MKLPRLARGAAVIAAVAALCLTSTLSAGGAEPGGAEARGDQKSMDAARATLIATMQRDLGMTKEQASLQLSRQTTATAVEAGLVTKLGKHYGGSWFDGRLGKLVVGVTSADRVAQVRAAGAEAVVVKRSQASLDAVKAELDAVNKKDATVLAAATTWSVDPMLNQVVMTVHKGRSAEVSASLAKFGDAVRVDESDLAPVTTADYLDGGDPYNGCSVGFNVVRGGVGHFLTAGHCGTAGTAAYQNGVHIGPFLESWFPGDDDALVRNDNPGYWVQGPWVFAYNGDPNAVYNINGYRTSPVGTVVCKSGRTTGLTCGWIRAHNQTVTYNPGGTVYQLTRHSACVEQGDSGGSNFSSDASGNWAEGMSSGAQLRSDGTRLRCLGAFGQESVSWYQPVAESISYYGVQIMTV